MIQQATISIYIALGLTFIINWFLFEFIYDQIIYREMRIFKKWKPSWTTLSKLVLLIVFITAIFTVVFYLQYSKTTTLTNSELWFSALDVAWTHLVLVFSIGFLLVFVIHSIVTFIVVLFQMKFFDGILNVSPELAGKTEKDNYRKTRALMIVPLLKAPKSRLFAFSWLFPSFSFLFHCESIFLLVWVFLDIFLASLIAYPVTFWLLKILFIDTIDLQMIMFGSFDPNLGWQYPSAFGFTFLSSHITTTTNLLIQQPVVESILGFLVLVTTAISSLIKIKKEMKELSEKTEQSQIQKTG